MQSDNLDSLILKTIESYARVETKVISLEQSIGLLREDNKTILLKISEALDRLATIAEKQNQNNNDHVIIHDRIDEVKSDLTHTDRAIESLRLSCAAVNHSELFERMGTVERQLHTLCDNLKIVSFKIGSFPVWMIVGLLLVFMGISGLVNKQYGWVKGMIFW